MSAIISNVESFNSASRIKKRSEFSLVQKEGIKIYSKHFAIVLRPSTSEISRLGITISKKVNKKAVVRNYLKRVLREIFRKNKAQLKGVFDIVIIARAGASECRFAQAQKEVLGALKYHKYI